MYAGLFFFAVDSTSVKKNDDPSDDRRLTFQAAHVCQCHVTCHNPKTTAIDMHSVRVLLRVL